MHGFVQKVRAQIGQHQLLEPAQQVVAAVSAGPDSVAMARALSELPYALEIAHVDHQTRPETVEDAAFVAALAADLGVPFHALSCDPGSGSEDALRNGRYAALESLDAAAIATGHTANDQAETVLMRLLRGTGVAGLAGIPSQRNTLVRPLLGVTRDEVLAFLGDLGQSYRTDPSNAGLDPLRNRVRHVLLPMLEAQFQPNVKRALVRLADAAASDRAFIEACADAHLAEYGLEVAALRSVHRGLRPHVLRRAAKVPITSERMAAILRLLDGKGGAVQLEGGMTVEIGKQNPKGLPNGSRRIVFMDSGRAPARKGDT